MKLVQIVRIGTPARLGTIPVAFEVAYAVVLVRTEEVREVTAHAVSLLR